MADILPLKGTRETRATILVPLQDLVTADIAKVNKVIVERMHSRVELIPQLAGHIIASGGKRLRPMLTLASAQLCGYAGDRHVHLAACVEFLHTATLLHDDVVDESDLRRGAATANATDCDNAFGIGTCAGFYEWNARVQLTTWNPTTKDAKAPPGGPLDYASKQNSGTLARLHREWASRHTDPLGQAGGLN